MWNSSDKHFLFWRIEVGSVAQIRSCSGSFPRVARENGRTDARSDRVAQLLAAVPPARARRHGTRCKFQSVFSAATAQQSCKYHGERKKEGRKRKTETRYDSGKRFYGKEERIDEKKDRRA